MATLYLETNYLISIAKGQDSRDIDLLTGTGGTQPIALAIPCVCFMEALTTLKADKAYKNEFEESLSEQIREAGRDATSPAAKRLHSYLLNAKIAWADYKNDIVGRLHDVMKKLSQMAEILPLGRVEIAQSLTHQLIDDATDNLILHCILEHARWSGPGPKAFLSGNVKDFNTPQVKNALHVAGVNYFRKADAALGWFLSQSQSI